MATHSSTLAWKIPWTEELAGYSPWGCKESDTTVHRALPMFYIECFSGKKLLFHYHTSLRSLIKCPHFVTFPGFPDFQVLHHISSLTPILPRTCLLSSPYVVLSFALPYISVSEKAVAPHSSTLAWKIPWMEEPGRLQSNGLLRVGHN